mgnify:CR=1 FL=1
MKYYSIILLTMINLSLYSQNYPAIFRNIEGGDKVQIFSGGSIHSEDSVEINYLLVYKSLEDDLYINNGVASPRKKWVTHFRSFESEKDLFDYLNYANLKFFFDEERKDVRISADQIIGIWDLTTAEKIAVVLRQKKMRKEREVVIEAEEWINEWFERK